jgi:hypothetical protein
MNTVENLKRRGVKVQYEKVILNYTVPASNHRYITDIVLPNGIIVEIKGRLTKADRDKHLLLKAQHPDKDIRFLFSAPNNKICKGSKTTYTDWCDKNDIKWCEKEVPLSWIEE